MTKAQARDVAQARQALALGMPDFAARSLSALIRSAMRNSDKAALLAVATELGVHTHPEFIV